MELRLFAFFPLPALPVAAAGAGAVPEAIIPALVVEFELYAETTFCNAAWTA